MRTGCCVPRAQPGVRRTERVLSFLSQSLVSPRIIWVVCENMHLSCCLSLRLPGVERRRPWWCQDTPPGSALFGRRPPSPLHVWYSMSDPALEGPVLSTSAAAVDLSQTQVLEVALGVLSSPRGPPDSPILDQSLGLGHEMCSGRAMDLT